MDEIEQLKAEIERLKKLLGEAYTVIYDARLFKGYDGGPLHMPYADVIAQKVKEEIDNG